MDLFTRISYTHGDDKNKDILYLSFHRIEFAESSYIVLYPQQLDNVYVWLRSGSTKGDFTGGA